MKSILLTIALCAPGTAFAQINVGAAEILTPRISGKAMFGKGDLERLKSTITLFVLQERDTAHTADFERAIKSAWSLTKFKIIRYNEVYRYAKKGGYSFFSFRGYYHAHNTLNGLVFLARPTYDLWIPKINKEGAVAMDKQYASILLSQETFITPVGRNLNFQPEKDYLDFIYNDAVSGDWGAGYLEGYLRTVNSLLEQDMLRCRLAAEEHVEDLAALTNDTLYVPDHVNTYFNYATAEKRPMDEFELMLPEVYTHPLRLLSAAQINEKIMNSTGPVNYMVFLRADADKFVTVYNSKKGLIYSRHVASSNNMKNRDLKLVDDLVRKQERKGKK